MSSPSASTAEVPASSAATSAPATSAAQPSSSQAAPTSASQPSASSAVPTTSAAAAPTTTAQQSSSQAPSQAPSSSTQAQPTSQPQSTSAAQSTTSNPPSSAPSSSAVASSSAPASSEAPVTSAPATTLITVTSTNGGSVQTSVVVVTNTSTVPNSSTATSTSSSANPSLAPGDSSSSGSTGLKTDAKVAIGVVVPIAGIALIAIAALFFWRKRKARLAAEEERRKEVEDYSYNPNADPTIPGVVDGGYEMRDDSAGGYRGWGTTTLASSNGRKASTTLSSGKNAYSDPSSPTQAPIGMARSDNVYSPDGEILGAMNGSGNGNNRGVGVDRGPSNASSSYSAANRSDGSDLQGGVSYGQGATYYDVQDQEPYPDGHYTDAPAQPVIRDNPARRNTRIENTSHYPQQSAGISQNF